MKTIAYYALHYGKEYLAWSIRSVQDSVDEIHVLYTDVPSYGHTTPMPCPDTEAELHEEAEQFLNKPLFWHRGRWPNETEHRNAILPIARERGADLILVVDADELWDPTTLREAVEEVRGRTEDIIRVNFIHFWRSWYWVCKDPCMPTRFVRPGGERKDGYIRHMCNPVFHFGYAQKPETILYKQEIHGHKAEWRKGWYENTFLAWKPGMTDVHPTCEKDFWHPETITPPMLHALGTIAGDHPYTKLEPIS